MLQLTPWIHDRYLFSGFVIIDNIMEKQMNVEISGTT